MGDDLYAQDWSRGCGSTAGKKVYAGISGKIVKAYLSASFGNTVVIYDQRSSFALRYAHLSQMSVREGNLVLAGISEIGKVGNTGTSVATACATDPGAHLHLSLYRNVKNINATPITAINSSDGTHRASFGYVASLTLIKGDQTNAVYVTHGITTNDL